MNARRAKLPELSSGWIAWSDMKPPLFEWIAILDEVGVTRVEWFEDAGIIKAQTIGFGNPMPVFWVLIDLPDEPFDIRELHGEEFDEKLKLAISEWKSKK